MPRGLRRYQQAKHFHFVTFSCYQRGPKLGTAESRDVFERSLEQVRVKYGLYVTGYVAMPEHVHLLVSEPRVAVLATALQSLKQSVARSRSGRIGITTSTCIASASGWRSCGTSTGIRWCVD